MATTADEIPPDAEFEAPFIAIVFYSKRGRLVTLANAIAEGARAVGADVQLFRVPHVTVAGGDGSDREDQPERFAEEYLSLPVVQPHLLKQADGIIVGSPGRQGRICAEVSAFLDSLAPLQTQGALTGKLGAAFTSAGGVGRGFGGHESILQNFHATFLQQGMLVVGVPPSSVMDDAPLASPYGACMAGAAGSGSRALSDAELTVAQQQGSFMATIAMRLKAAEDVAALE